MAVQADLCRTWSEASIVGFLMRMLILYSALDTLFTMFFIYHFKSVIHLCFATWFTSWKNLRSNNVGARQLLVWMYSLASSKYTLFVNIYVTAKTENKTNMIRFTHDGNKMRLLPVCARFQVRVKSKLIPSYLL